MKIHYFDQLESTNNYCKLLDMNNVEEFTVILARSQTAGIGQQGNVWESSPGLNLTFSVVLKPTFLLAVNQFQLTMATALAISSAVRRVIDDINPSLSELISIKWPNDIYFENSKLCGFLSSVNLHSGVVTDAILGVGLNVNQTSFYSWIPNPISLKSICGISFDLDFVLQQLLSQIEYYYLLLREHPESLKVDYLASLYRFGRSSLFDYKGKHLNATIVDVDNFGRLQLLTDSGDVISCNLKEIRYLFA